MVYSIALSETAKANLKGIDKSVAKRIADKLDSITDSPIAFVKRLKGVKLYSLRVGDYRVIMSIDEGGSNILVMGIGHRKRIYDEF